MRERMNSGWFGPGNPALSRPRGGLPPGTPQRGVPLPRSIRQELALIAAAARTAGQGNSRAGAKMVSNAEATLLRRATMGPTVDDYAHIDNIGYEAWLDEQLDYTRLDNSALEDSLLENLPTLAMTAAQLHDEFEDNPFIPIFELWVATLFRALYSPRQLFERMSVFWADHFSIDIFGDYMEFLKPVDERTVGRANALGNFPSMLSASAHSPAMLIYLTNDTNEKNHPNENYARELMELHTMGADNGYTETDVKEVARCFTGWTWTAPYRGSGDGELGTFRFSKRDHDKGKKKVLGKTIPAGGGIDDGERVIDILANRRETADFIATKMLRWLHGYEPSKKLVRKVSKAYQRTDGDIRTMVRTALRAKQMQSATPKLKRPFHLVVSSLRALGGNVEAPNRILGHLSAAGHLPFTWTPPNGYPDTSQWWSSLLISRWDYAASLADDETVAFDPAIDDPSGSTGKIVNRLDTLLLNGQMSADTRAALNKFLGQRKSRTRVREAIGLVVSAPEFQEY